MPPHQRIVRSLDDVVEPGLADLLGGEIARVLPWSGRARRKVKVPEMSSSVTTSGTPSRSWT